MIDHQHGSGFPHQNSEPEVLDIGKDRDSKDFKFM